MPVKNRILPILFGVILILPEISHTQDLWSTINPGFKLGYSFGENKGFIYGAEVSFVIRNKYDALYGGLVLGVDRLSDLSKVHFGIEGGDGLFGVCIGPTLLLRNNEHDFGYTFTAYAGGLLIPFISTTGSSKFGSVNEVGSFVKIPIKIYGKYSPWINTHSFY